MGDLTELPNIGKVLAEQLKQVGISSSEELQRVGAKEAWARIKQIDSSACLHRLMALEGAIKGVKKVNLDKEIKKDLKEFYKNNRAYY